MVVRRHGGAGSERIPSAVIEATARAPVRYDSAGGRTRTARSSAAGILTGSGSTAGDLVKERRATMGGENGNMLTRDEARELYARFTEARNREELTLLDEVYAPDVVLHDCSVPEPIRGLDALKAYYRGSHEGLPGLRFELGNPMVDGEWMAVRWVLHASHTGNLRGLPATGRAVRVEGMMVDRVVAGRIVEEWVDYDTLSLFFQLGFALVPPENVPKG